MIIQWIAYTAVIVAVLGVSTIIIEKIFPTGTKQQNAKNEKVN